MAVVSVKQVNDFTGGLNYRADQFQLANNESPKMLNVEIDPRGGVFSRGGQRSLNATAITGTWAPRSLYDFAGTTSTIMLSTATKIQRATSGTFSLLKTDVSTDVAVTDTNGASFATWNDTLYAALGNGSSSISWKTTDTYATILSPSGTAPDAWQATAVTAGKFPKANIAVVHANKMWVANTNEGGTAHPNRIRYSFENAPTDWDEDSFIDIHVGGVGIMGLVVVAGQLLVVKPNAVYAIYGYDAATFRVVKVAEGVGAPSKRAVVGAENAAYFFDSSEGLFVYDGSSVTNLWANLRPLHENGFINETDSTSTSVSYINRRIWISIPHSDSGVAATTPTVNYVFDPQLGGVFVAHKTSDSKGLVSGCNWTDGTGMAHHLMCHPSQAYVMDVDMFDEAYDNISGADATFPSTYRTKWFDAGSYTNNKMFRRPDFVLKEASQSQTIVCDVYHNFDESVGNQRRSFNLTQSAPTSGGVWGTGLWGTAVWGGGAVSSKRVTGNNLGLARTVQLEFTGPTGQHWGLNSIGYKFQQRRVKG